MKQILLLGLALAMAVSSFAQDKITMKDGSVSVKSITEHDVHYSTFIWDEKGNIYLDRSAVLVMQLDKVEAITDSSGRVLFPTMHRRALFANNQVSPYVVPQYKNPAFAFLLSAIPGCGQFYNDDIGKGFAFLVGTLAESAICVYSYKNLTTIVSEYGREKEVVDKLAAACAIASGVALLITCIGASIDAVITANRLNIANGYVLSVDPLLSYNQPEPGSSVFQAGLSFRLSF